MSVSEIPSWLNRTYYPTHHALQRQLNRLSSQIVRYQYSNHFGQRTGPKAHLRNKTHYYWFRYIHPIFLKSDKQPPMQGEKLRAISDQHLSARNQRPIQTPRPRPLRGLARTNCLVEMTRLDVPGYRGRGTPALRAVPRQRLFRMLGLFQQSVSTWAFLYRQLPISSMVQVPLDRAAEVAALCPIFSVWFGWRVMSLKRDVAFFHHPLPFLSWHTRACFPLPPAAPSSSPTIRPFRGDGSLEYSPLATNRRIYSAFGCWPWWAPVSGVVREQLRSFSPLLTMTSENWTNTFDPNGGGSI